MKGKQKTKRKAGYRGGNKPQGRTGIFSTRLPFIDINETLKTSEKYSDKILREEYARLRKAASSRIKRLSQSGIGGDILTKYKEGFKTTRSITTREDLVENLRKVSGFLASEKSTVSGNKPKGRFDVFSSKLPFIDINPRLKFAEKYNEKTIREEYKRLRKIAEARLKRIRASGIGKDILEQNRGGFKSAKDIKTRKELVENLLKVTQFLTAKRSTVSGIREHDLNAAAALQAKGINVTEDDLEDFGGFVKTVKDTLGLTNWKNPSSSSYISEYWDKHKNGKMNFDQVEEYFEKNKGDVLAKIDKDAKAKRIGSQEGLPF